MHDLKAEQAIADILRLLSPGRHPDSERLERESTAWFDRQELPGLSPKCRKRLQKSQIGTGVGAAFPSAGYAAAFFWSRFSFCYMIVDDAYAESRAGLDVSRFLLEVGQFWRMSHHSFPVEVPDDPFAAVLQGLFRELDSLVVAPVADRIRQAFRDYLFAAGWEAAVWVAGQSPRADEYRSFRRHFTQFVLNIEFVEHLPEALLSDEDRRDPRIHGVRALACDIMANINDICSFEFEAANDNILLPDDLVQGNHAGFPIEVLREVCCTQISTLTEAVNSLGAQPELRPYGEAITRWVAGAVWWHYQALQHRYLVEGK